MLPFSLKILTSVVIILRVLLSLALTSSSINLEYSRNLAQASYFVGRIGFLPYITGQVSPSSALVLGGQVLKGRDQGWLEYATYTSLSSNLYQTGGLLHLIQSNGLKIHFLSFLI